MPARREVQRPAAGILHAGAFEKPPYQTLDNRR